MALIKELLQLLDNKDEPLLDRLKLADKAFKSSKLPLRRKTASLLKWLAKTTKSREKYSWELLLSWLKSPQVQDITRIEISLDELRHIVNIITKRYNPEEHTEIIMQCLIEIIENRTFQLYVKSNLEWYCKFVAAILLKIESVEQLHIFLSNDNLFHRYVIHSNNFHSNFFQYVFPALEVVVIMFKDVETFLKTSTLMDNCIFRHNFKVFSEYFTYIFEGGGEGDHNLPNLLFNGITQVNAELLKVVFHSFCNSYDNFSIIYKFFAVLLDGLGFKTLSFFDLQPSAQSATVNNNISTASKLCEVLSEKSYDLSLQLKGKSFVQCLEYVLTEAFDLNQSCDEMYGFLNQTIVLHPLVLKTHLDKVLVYAFNDQSNSVEREKFMLGLFEVFTKLHRIPALIKSMIVTVKDNKFDSVSIPAKVLEYFCQCVTALASSQILELHKLFLVHLDDAVANMDDRVSYVEFISALLGQFLMSVRMAEHTVSDKVSKNFFETMTGLKDVLQKFGTKLVSLEHNPRLMHSYLTLCLKWGDLYIILLYYSNDFTSFQRTVDNDYSATNINYLHSYITRDQWRLISQRIANFGEKPCKQIMQNLCVQKLKAMHLFENSINPDVLAPISSNILSTLDEQDDDLLFDPFVLRHIIFSNRDEKSAKVLVKRIVTGNDSDKIQLLFDNSYISEVLHVVMHRINKAFEKDTRSKTLTSKLLSNTNAFRFDSSSISDDDANYCVDEEEMNANLELIKAIPVAQFEDSIVLETMFAFMLALMVDLNKCALKESALLEKCENIIFGIAQSLKLSRTIIEKNTVQLIIKNLNRYDKVFNFFLQSLFRNTTQSDCIGDIFETILENLNQDRYICCATVFLEHLDRYKSSKLSEELKNCYHEMCQRLLSIVRVVDASNLMEAYAFVLKWCLFRNDEDDLQKLLPHLDAYVDLIVNGDYYIKGSMLLLSVIVKNKSKCLTAKTTMTKIWECVNRLKIQKEYKFFAKLVALTVQHIPEDEFSASCAKLLAVTDESIKSGHFDDHLKIWTSISSASLSNAQIKVWQNTLETFIYRKILPRLQKNEDFSKQLTRVELSFLENPSLPLSSSLLEAVLMTVSLTANDTPDCFVDSFNLSLSLLESLIKNRKTLVVDFIPMYMQRYRKLLNHLCINADCELKLSHDDVQKMGNCSHKFEKLTKSLVTYERDLSRICPNIMADILQQFERRTIYSNVKVHLNNCLYLFLSLCDEHSVSYLKCVLSTASTEMFRVIYENYNKFYKFTGKV